MNNILERIEQIGIVPVVKITQASDAIPLAHALYDGGIDVAEITFRSEHAVESIKTIHKELPDMLLGAGSVRTITQAHDAIQAGASFIVTPGFNVHVVTWCLEHNVLVLPGVSSASEIESALDMGLTTLKFFPAESSGGAQKLKDLSGPYPNVTFLPTGGISNKNMHEYLALPNVMAIGGSYMLNPQHIQQQDWNQVRIESSNAVRSMLSYELIHIGINETSSEEAEKSAKLLCELFQFDYYKKPKSHFAGRGFEVLNQVGIGTHGHIGIYTPYPQRAMYQLAKKGITFKTDSITRNKKTNKINFVYLDVELSGFGIHLINPDVKM